MGFRNPITTAAALDTGAGNAPGVRVYASGSNPASGVVEWDAYTSRVKGTLTSSQTGSGGSFFTLGMDNGPSLQLNVEPVPAGGYADAIRVSDPIADLTPATALTFPNPTLFGPWGNAGYEDPYCYRDANNNVHVGGLVRCFGAGNWSAGASFAQLPAGCRPARNRFALCPTGQSGYGLFLMQVQGDGNITWQGNPDSIGWSYAAQSWVDLSTIKPFKAVQ